MSRIRCAAVRPTRARARPCRPISGARAPRHARRGAWSSLVFGTRLGPSRRSVQRSWATDRDPSSRSAKRNRHGAPPLEECCSATPTSQTATVAERTALVTLRPQRPVRRQLGTCSPTAAPSRAGNGLGDTCTTPVCRVRDNAICGGRAALCESTCGSI